MLKVATARGGTMFLSAAIAEIVDQVNPGVMVALQDHAFAERVRQVEVMGPDVAVLAAAVGVLKRWSPPDNEG
jgi:hypothetical protein